MLLPLLDRAEDADRYEVVSGGFDESLFTAATIGEHDHVLDIGCGYGRTTLLAAPGPYPAGSSATTWSSRCWPRHARSPQRSASTT